MSCFSRLPCRLSPSSKAQLSAHQAATVGEHGSCWFSLWCPCPFCEPLKDRAHVQCYPLSTGLTPREVLNKQTGQ